MRACSHIFGMHEDYQIFGPLAIFSIDAACITSCFGTPERKYVGLASRKHDVL